MELERPGEFCSVSCAPHVLGSESSWPKAVWKRRGNFWLKGGSALR